MELALTDQFPFQPATARAAARLSVAPMMDWTDRFCRRFHREISRGALLYTEMVTAPAVLHGNRAWLLDFDPVEQPVALQLGGSNPAELREAARIAAEWGYAEINLNCGCPSDRVQSGAFGAVLMKTPDLVADCVAAMAEGAGHEVTIKCRIGVDDQNPAEVLPAFLETVAAAGVRRFTIHARKAWLQGLSPKENRDVPPLDYALVQEMKRAYPALHISINGGVASLAAAEALLAEGLDGVMVGRAAYHEPWNILGQADARLFGLPGPADPFAVAEAMRAPIAAHLAQGGRLHQISRHMLGLFHGRPGARGWRRALSEGACTAGAGLALYDAALAEVARA